MGCLWDRKDRKWCKEQDGQDEAETMYSIKPGSIEGHDILYIDKAKEVREKTERKPFYEKTCERF